MTSNSNLPKRRGRPLGSTNKRKVAKKTSAANIAFKQYVKQYNPVATLEKIKAIDAHVANQEIKILNLEHQIIGYKAVISYLEHQTGKTK